MIMIRILNMIYFIARFVIKSSKVKSSWKIIIIVKLIRKSISSCWKRLGMKTRSKK